VFAGVGDGVIVTTTGVSGAAAGVGDGVIVTTTGVSGVAAGVGDGVIVTTTGVSGVAAGVGDGVIVTTTGDCGVLEREAGPVALDEVSPGPDRRPVGAFVFGWRTSSRLAFRSETDSSTAVMATSNATLTTAATMYSIRTPPRWRILSL